MCNPSLGPGIADIPCLCTRISSEKLLKYQAETEAAQTEQWKKVESRWRRAQVRKCPDASLYMSSVHTGCGWWLHSCLTRRLIKMQKIWMWTCSSGSKQYSTAALHSRSTRFDEFARARTRSCRPWWCADEDSELQVALVWSGNGERQGWLMTGWAGWVINREAGCQSKPVIEGGCELPPLNFQCSLTAPAQHRVSTMT